MTVKEAERGRERVVVTYPEHIIVSLQFCLGDQMNSLAPRVFTGADETGGFVARDFVSLPSFGLCLGL